MHSRRWLLEETIHFPFARAAHYDDLTGLIYVGRRDHATRTGNGLYRIVMDGDTRIELDENFVVDLSNPANAGLGDAVGQGTILNDDQAVVPTVSSQTTARGRPSIWIPTWISSRSEV